MFKRHQHWFAQAWFGSDKQPSSIPHTAQDRLFYMLLVFKYATWSIYLPFLSKKDLRQIIYRFCIFKPWNIIFVFSPFLNYTFLPLSPLRSPPSSTKDKLVKVSDHFSGPEQIEITNSSTQDFQSHVFLSDLFLTLWEKPVLQPMSPLWSLKLQQ